MKNFVSLAVITLLLSLSNLSAGALYVSLESTNPVPPFSNWATAATFIQQAVTAAAVCDEVVVTNGIYEAVNVDKPLLLRSVNGPQVTIIDPARQSRCACLTSGASLAGFWLRHGAADSGGGVFCTSSDVFLTNCVITDNICTNSSGSASGSGGGVYGGTLYNCLVASNSAALSGGGVIGATLYNCTVSGNHAGQSGGGVYRSASANCIVYSNTALAYNNHGLSSFNYSCTTPMPTNGVGNITNAPVFVNYAAGDLRLMGTSPCLDAGNNTNVLTGVDLAGNPRIMRGNVDMGAYEFQGTNAVVFYAWMGHHGVLADGTTDYLDPDGDGMNNWQEWVCFTCPTNPLMALRMVSAVPTGPKVTVRWQSAPGVKYFIERSTNLTSFTLLATNLVAQTSQAVYTDTNVPGPGPFFYRVGVKPYH